MRIECVSFKLLVKLFHSILSRVNVNVADFFGIFLGNFIDFLGNFCLQAYFEWKDCSFPFYSLFLSVLVVFLIISTCFTHLPVLNQITKLEFWVLIHNEENASPITKIKCSLVVSIHDMLSLSTSHPRLTVSDTALFQTKGHYFKTKHNKTLASLYTGSPI